MDSKTGGAGMERHSELGRQQGHAEKARREHRDGMRWSFRILGVAASVTFLTLEVIYLEAFPLPWLFLTTALALVSASTGLLVIALVAERKYRESLKETGLPPGAVLSTDLSGSGVFMEDADWGLSGTADTLLKTDQGLVPVEVKTGHTPRKPHQSHRLQLASYMRLVEATTGTAPPYGLLTYPDGVFPVFWDDKLQKELKGLLSRMADAEKVGKADRDHHHRARCIGCARRPACSQALG